PAILQPLQSLQKQRHRLTVTYVSYDSAHCRVLSSRVLVLHPTSDLQPPQSRARSATTGRCCPRLTPPAPPAHAPPAPARPPRPADAPINALPASPVAGHPADPTAAHRAALRARCMPLPVIRSHAAACPSRWYTRRDPRRFRSASCHLPAAAGAPAPPRRPHPA